LVDALKDSQAWAGAEKLSELLAGDITQTFPSDTISEAIEQARVELGEIRQVELLSDLTITGDWAEGEFLVGTSKGVKQKFWVVFHRENGDWKLFGTRGL